MPDDQWGPLPSAPPLAAGHLPCPAPRRDRKPCPGPELPATSAATRLLLRLRPCPAGPPHSAIPLPWLLPDPGSSSPSPCWPTPAATRSPPRRCPLSPSRPNPPEHASFILAVRVPVVAGPALRGAPVSPSVSPHCCGGLAFTLRLAELRGHAAPCQPGPPWGQGSGAGSRPASLCTGRASHRPATASRVLTSGHVAHRHCALDQADVPRSHVPGSSADFQAMASSVPGTAWLAGPKVPRAPSPEPRAPHRHPAWPEPALRAGHSPCGTGPGRASLPSPKRVALLWHTMEAAARLLFPHRQLMSELLVRSEKNKLFYKNKQKKNSFS